MPQNTSTVVKCTSSKDKLTLSRQDTHTTHSLAWLSNQQLLVSCSYNNLSSVYSTDLDGFTFHITSGGVQGLTSLDGMIMFTALTMKMITCGEMEISKL